MRIFLIGFMGSGKSKTAEALSKVLKIPFVDTDVLVGNKTGISISDIFKLKGEEYFRSIEKEVLYTTKDIDSIIVSTGGGTPLHNANMDWMNMHGITVYLEANAGLIFHRLAHARSGRPLIENLSDVELMEFISGSLAVRSPVYSKATITVKAADMNIKALAEKIKDLIKK